MTKRTVSTGAIRLGFTFDPPAVPRDDAGLAGLERVVSSEVARALKDDPRSREQIAGAMSALLGETVSKLMLDAYASEARGLHNISAARFLAMIATTERFDLLDRLCRRIGAAVLQGDEIHTARLGHLQAQQAQIDQEIKQLHRQVQPIDRRVRA